MAVIPSSKISLAESFDQDFSKMEAAALAFAGKSVATPVISFLINKAFACLDKHLKADDMGQVKRRVETNLVHIQAVFEATEHEKVRQHGALLDAWLWQLRDAVEEAEDSLDDVEYYKMEDEIRACDLRDEVRNPISKFLRRKIVNKIAAYAPKSSTLERLRNAVLKLDDVAAGVGRFLQLLDLSGFSSSHQWQQQRCFAVGGSSRETSSILSANEVFGRNKEMERLIDHLLKQKDHESESSSSNISVFSIVGHGGMGKTTLAQAICTEKQVLEFFDSVIWVYVSNTFEAATIMSNILESITGERPTAITLDALQCCVTKKLGGKRVLLVLDDVWEDKDMNEWEKLLAAFRNCRRGSKILITTRMQSVASMAENVACSEGEGMKLNGLGEDDIFLLFNKHSFAGLNPADYTDLHPIGRKIIKQFRGCPLVAKVIGANLRDNLSYEYWDNILREDLKGLQGSMDDIMKVLRLSYYHLPVHLRICFRYCSIFPQNFKFETEKLVKMWMGSGLIPQDVNKARRPEDIAEEFLVHLTRKSFFDFTPRRDSDGVLGGHYVMHDLMHDLARSVSLGECARIDGNGCKYVERTVRHLCIKNIGILSTQEIHEISQLQNLRTLIVENHVKTNKSDRGALEKAIESLQGLRLLILNMKYGFAFSQKFADLRHLRYISVPWLSRERMCDVFKLYHLEIFDTSNYLTEPKQFRDLGNLAHLRYVNFGIGFQFPIGKLTSLQEVHAFWVQQKKGYRVSELKDLRSIRSIKLLGLENIEKPEEAAEAKLCEKIHLNSLLLEWSILNHERPQAQDIILDQLKPNTGLQDLSIVGYNGARPPSLPSLGELQLLRHLKLYSLLKLRHIGNISDGQNNRHIPPSERINVLLDKGFPPRLDTSVIEGCPELRELPALPTTVTQLKIDRVGLLHHPRVAVVHDEERSRSPSKLSCLLSAYIKNCALLTSLGGLFQQEEHLQALESLTVEGCENIEHVPLGFARMIRLRTLTIEKCQNLVSTGEVGSNLLPMSLEKLSVINCGGLVPELLSSLQGLSKLTKLELSHCLCLESLPAARVFKTLTALHEFRVRGCEKLSSLGGLGALPSVRELEIRYCTKLIDVASEQHSLVADDQESVQLKGCALVIDKLIIDHHSLLLVDPLRSLCFTTELIVQDGSSVEHVPEQWLLQNVASLKSINIWGAVSLESMPPSMRALPPEELGEFLLQSVPTLPSSMWKLDVLRSDISLRRR
ncbi:hypothetical protein ACP4OV_025247 [Aristida adscensionis]